MFIAILQQVFVTIVCVRCPSSSPPPPHPLIWRRVGGIAAGASAVAAAVWLERECFSAGLSVLYSSKALALIWSSLTCGGAGCRTAAEEIMRLQGPKPLLLLLLHHQFPFLASSLTSPSHTKDSSAQPSGHLINFSIITNIAFFPQMGRLSPRSLWKICWAEI